MLFVRLIGDNIAISIIRCKKKNNLQCNDRQESHNIGYCIKKINI